MATSTSRSEGPCVLGNSDKRHPSKEMLWLVGRPRTDCGSGIVSVVATDTQPVNHVSRLVCASLRICSVKLANRRLLMVWSPRLSRGSCLRAFPSHPHDGF